MAHFLFQVSYTPEAWKKLVANPVNRAEVLKPVVAKLGGKLENGWFTFGEYDVVVLAQMPDAVAAGAFAVAVGAGGACKTVKTTQLFGFEEGLSMCKKAADCGYLPHS